MKVTMIYWRIVFFLKENDLNQVSIELERYFRGWLWILGNVIVYELLLNLITREVYKFLL